RAVCADDPFWRAGRAAAHQQDRRILWTYCRAWRPPAAVYQQQVSQVVIARGDGYAIAVVLLAQEREEHPQRRRKVLFDVRGDHSPDRRLWLHPFDPFVEPRQRHDRLHAVLAQRTLELVLRVGRVQRRDDGAELPGAE